MTKNHASQQPTGLPELPQKYFWQVKLGQNEYDMEHYQLQIRRKYWIGSRRRYSTELRHYMFDDYYQKIGRRESRFVTAEGIRKAAEYLITIFNQDRELSPYIGKYPPKNLDTVETS